MAKKKTHFLHIGKTGGTAVKAALKGHEEGGNRALVFHNHWTGMNEIPPGEDIVFFLRDPISRFVSAFYSRKRKGLPRYHGEWTAAEEKIFTTFETPNALACALAEPSSPHHALARQAMKVVRHLNRHYSVWCGEPEAFRARSGDVLFVGFQETLAADFERLKRLLDLPATIALPADDYTAHRNPADLDRSLDERALGCLRNWYRADFEFLALCKDLMAQRNTAQ